MFRTNKLMEKQVHEKVIICICFQRDYMYKKCMVFKLFWKLYDSKINMHKKIYFHILPRDMFHNSTFV